MPANIEYDYTDNIPAQPGEVDTTPWFVKAHQKEKDIRKRDATGFLVMRTRAGARTITKGGWNSASDAAFEEAGSGPIGMAKRAFKEAHHPRSLYQGPTQLEFDPRKNSLLNSQFFKEGKTGGSMADQETRRLGSKIVSASKYNPETKEYGSVFGKAASKLGLMDKGALQHVIDPKFAARLSAAADYSGMGTLTGGMSAAGELSGQSGNLINYVRHAGAEDMAKALEGAAQHGVQESLPGMGGEAVGGISGDLASQATRLSAQGALTGSVAGYLHAAAGNAVDPLIEGTTSAAVNRGLQFGEKSWATRQEFQKNGLRGAMERNQGLRDAAKAAGKNAGKGAGEAVDDFAGKTVGQILAENGVTPIVPLSEEAANTIPGAVQGTFAGMGESAATSVGEEAASAGATVAGEAASAAAAEVGDAVVNVGLRAGATTLGELAGSFAASVAGSGAMGGLNVAMDAYAIYTGAKLLFQVGKLGFDLAGHEIQSDLKSFNGQRFKDPMGMGYRDSAAAATSRSRGVMAISNSRLNARSLLGHEAGQMHAHFG